MNITPNSATNPSEPAQPATLTPLSAAVPEPSALSIAVQYHQPGRNLAMVTITAGIITSAFSDAIVFAILIIVLLVKPSGIMGKNEGEKV